MIWDPQLFDSLGHFLPKVVDITSLWIMCIAILSSVRLDAIHFAFLFGTHLCPAGWSSGSMSEERRSCKGRMEGGQNCRRGTEILSSRFRFCITRLVMEKGKREHAGVEWNVVQRRLWSQRFNKGNKGSVVAFMSAVFVSCWTFGYYECRHMSADAFLFFFVLFHLLFNFIYQPLAIPPAGFSWAWDVRLYLHQHHISPNTSSATSTSSRYVLTAAPPYRPSARRRNSIASIMAISTIW